jgi:hypothetical protein
MPAKNHAQGFRFRTHESIAAAHIAVTLALPLSTSCA